MKWVCMDCVDRLGSKAVQGHVSTWHTGVCDFCQKFNIAVTEPRDFRPRPDERKKRK